MPYSLLMRRAGIYITVYVVALENLVEISRKRILVISIEDNNEDK